MSKKNNDTARDVEVEKSLSVIFEGEGKDATDLGVIDRKRSNVWLMAGIGVSVFLTILLAAIWAGFVIFKPFRGFSGQGLKILVDGPERVTIGSETTYFINWQNVSSEPLASAEIRVSFPPDFSPTKIEPDASGDGFVWRLGSVPLDGRGTMTIRGFFTGALGTQTAIQAVGTYRPASFNSDFESLATRKIEYGDSVIAGLLDLPPKALPGDTIRIAYTITNSGTGPMKGLEARLTLPSGFVLDATTTSVDIEGDVVKMPVGTIESNTSTTVAVTGTFASGAGGNVPIHAEAGRIDTDGSFLAVQKTDSILEVLTGDLSVKLVVNGSDTDRSIAEGDVLRFTLGYENTATEDIKDVKLRVIFEPIGGTTSTAATTTAKTVSKNAKTSKVIVTPPSFADWSQLDDSSSGTVSGNAITWDASGLGALERLTPGQDGEIEFSVPSATSASSSAPLDGFQIVAEATMGTVGTSTINRTIRTKPMVLKFRSDADLASEARYYSEEGAPVGSGPLPPVSGQTTTYRINWTITKQVHELTGIKVSATLPKSVTWPANTNVTAGEMKYDESSRTVTWTLNRLPTDVHEADAAFDVQLTPSDLDVGRFAVLIGETRFEATDAVINEPILKVKPGLSTDLQNDDGAKNKGVVRKP